MKAIRKNSTRAKVSNFNSTSRSLSTKVTNLHYWLFDSTKIVSCHLSVKLSIFYRVDPSRCLLFPVADQCPTLVHLNKFNLNSNPPMARPSRVFRESSETRQLHSRPNRRFRNHLFRSRSTFWLVDLLQSAVSNAKLPRQCHNPQ